MSNIFGIGLSGLNAAQAGLATTAHNIANVNTPNYSRQQIEQAASLPMYTGSGYMGTGTSVSTVQRVYNDFLNNQVQQAQAGTSQLDTYLQQINQINNLMGDSTTGVQPAINAFFSAMNGVAADPGQAPSLETALSSAQSLAGTVQSAAQSLSAMGAGVNQQLQGAAGTINTLATQVASLNQEIAADSSSSAGLQPPNDLLDQRDALMTQINQQIGVTSVKDGSTGAIDVYMSNGQALVVDNQAFTLSTVPDNANPTQLQLGVQAGKTVVTMPPADITGGLVGGLLAFRDGTLENAQNSLGRVAIVLAQGVNAQQALGQDQNGQLGQPIFAFAGPQVTPASSNTGTGAVTASISNAGALSTSNYELDYNGSHYTLTRLSDGTAQTYGSLPQSVDGFTLSLSGGTPQAGDSFLIQPTANAASSLSVVATDPAQIAAAAPILGSASATNTGSGTITQGSVNAPPPPNANLQQPVTISFHNSGGAITYDVSGTGTGNPSGLAYTPGASISYNGWSVAVSGTPADGDTFGVGPNSGATGDNRNALLMANLQNANLVATSSGVPNSMSLTAAFGEMVTGIGNQASSIQASDTAQTNVLNQATASQQSVSGVNLDEEAANMIKYQQAYQAASQVMVVANQLFTSLLALFQ